MSEPEYDAAQDAYESWLLAINELRRQHLEREAARTDEFAPLPDTRAG